MNVNWKEVSSIGGAGAFGGAASLVYSLTIGTRPVVSPLPFGVLAYAFLGSIAALLGVYLIAKTDTSHAIHALIFALACGISWAPILDGASALVQRNREKALTARVEEGIKGVREAAVKLRNASPEQLPASSSVAVQQVESLFSAAAESRDPRLAFSVRRSVGELIASLEDVSKRDPLVVKRTLRDIRMAQVISGFQEPSALWTRSTEENVAHE